MSFFRGPFVALTEGHQSTAANNQFLILQELPLKHFLKKWAYKFALLSQSSSRGQSTAAVAHCAGKTEQPLLWHYQTFQWVTWEVCSELESFPDLSRTSLNGGSKNEREEKSQAVITPNYTLMIAQEQPQGLPFWTVYQGENKLCCVLSPNASRASNETAAAI